MTRFWRCQIWTLRTGTTHSMMFFQRWKFLLIPNVIQKKIHFVFDQLCIVTRLQNAVSTSLVHLAPLRHMMVFVFCRSTSSTRRFCHQYEHENYFLFYMITIMMMVLILIQIYILIWFWFVFLTIVSGLNLVWRVSDTKKLDLKSSQASKPHSPKLRPSDWLAHWGKVQSY